MRLADALGRPLAFDLASGNAADCKAYDVLIVLPERTPDALLADNGYDAGAIRADFPKRNITPVIPGRSNRRVRITERSTSRAIATRYDQLASSFLGMVHVAAAKYWFKWVHAA